MTQTIFTDSVKVQGSQDAPQLQVQSNTTQTQPLQNWLDSTGNVKAQVTGDGRFQIGNNLGSGAPSDALIQANNDITVPSSLPVSGWHTLGRLTGALTSAVNWVVHELQLLGTGGVSGLQSAMRVKLTHANTGSSTSAELRAADFQSINQTGTSSASVYRATGLRGTASNAANAYLTKAVGVESTITNDTNATLTQASAFEVAAPVNSGTIGTLNGLLIPDLTQGVVNIAIQTGLGIVRIGDHEEIKVLTSTPTNNPPAGLIKLYPKLNAGIPTLYAKDTTGTEFIVGGGGAGSAPLALIGQSDNVQLLVKGNTTQTNDIQEWQDSNSNVLSRISPGGSLYIYGQANEPRLQIKASSTQTTDLQQWQNYNGSNIANLTAAGVLNLTGSLTTPSLTASVVTTGTINGGVTVLGQSNTAQLIVRANTVQTNDLQQWQNSAGLSIIHLTPTGSLYIYGQADEPRLQIKASSTQTTDLQQWQDYNGNNIANLTATGVLTLTGSLITPSLTASTVTASTVTTGTMNGGVTVLGNSDTAQLIVRANAVQTNDLQQWQNNAGLSIVHLTPTGSLYIYGQADEPRLQIKASSTQTTDLQQWQDYNGNNIANLTAAGVLNLTGSLVTSSVKLTNGAATGKFLRSDSSGNGTWQSTVTSVGLSVPSFLSVSGSPITTTGTLAVSLSTQTANQVFAGPTSGGAATPTFRALVASDLASALASPPAIGGTTPAAGAFTTLKLTTGAATGKFLQSNASGNGAWQDAVTSVAMSVPSFLSVSGSPITTSGTLAVSLATQSANLIFSGPASGGATVPTFRALAASDLTSALASPPAIGGTTPAAGAFTTLKLTTGAATGKFLQSNASGNGAWQDAVTSVAMSVPSFLSVSGSPITTSGTLAVSLATQSANLIFAGPASGGATAPTFRALAASDLTSALASPSAIGGTTPASGTFTALTGTTSVAAALSDAGTTNVTNIGLFTHNSSGAVAAGLGAGVLLAAQSSTTAGRAQGRMRTQWVTATDASRTAKLVLSAYDTAERDGLTIQASGSASMIGFLGASPATQQTGGSKTAAATYSINEQAMLQAAYNALRTFGLLS